MKLRIFKQYGNYTAKWGFLFLFFVFFAACGNAEPEVPQADTARPITKYAFSLNTVIRISVYDTALADDTIHTILADCITLCEQYEALFSRTRSDSELAAINAAPYEAHTLSEDTAALLKTALNYCALSNGLFDISIAPLTRLWDFTAQTPVVPDADALKRAAELTDYRNLLLKESTTGTVSLTFRPVATDYDELPGLDLGAIAKGYIADRIKALLAERGVQSALISLGGNVLCLGSRPDGTDFQIGIRKPFGAPDETLLTVAVQDYSVVSSGVYERYFEQDGVRYHHLLHPETGLPITNGLTAVTILSPQSVDGDALSTVCFSLGLEAGLALADELPDVYALFVTDDGSLHGSEGFFDFVPVTE